MKFFKVLFITVIFLATSCVSTKLEVDPSLAGESNPALLTSLTINLAGTEDAGIIEMAQDLKGAMDLDDMGMKTEDSLREFLSQHGLELFTDKEHAEGGEMAFKIPSMPLLGYWKHPDTTGVTPAYFTGLTIGFDKQEYINKVKGSYDTEYFIFANIEISKAYSFGIFGGYPIAWFNVAVVDSMGETVVKAQAYGMGKKSIIGVDQSEENLSMAVDEAIKKLNEL